MKQFALIVTVVALVGCSDVQFTYNGLICPTNDINEIRDDLKTCKVYNVKEVDKAFENEECKMCLESKGYKVEQTDNNASQ